MRLELQDDFTLSNVGQTWVLLPHFYASQKRAVQALFCDMVEMVGVEPTSKNISEELSPSAVSALSFAESAVTLTHYGTAIL